MSKNYIDDPLWAIDNPDIGVFRDYLDSMEEFLQAERQKHTNSMDDLNEKIKSGEMSPHKIRSSFHLRLNTIIIGLVQWTTL